MNNHLLAALSLLAATGCSLAPSLSVTPRYGRLDVDGDLRVSSLGSGASSSASALGLGGDDVLMPRVDASLGGLDLMASGFSGNFGGRGRAQAQIDLAGVSISAGEPVESSLDLTVANLIATFDLVPSDLFDVGIGLGASYIDFDGGVRSLSSGLSVESSESFVIPVLAARLGTRIGPLALRAHGSGLSGSYAGVDATFVDVDLFGEYTFWEVAGVDAALVLGYRQIVLDVGYTDAGSDVRADLSFSGPYFGLTVGI